ncbi:MAG: extracellular solute-binding protein [Sphaerochaetaceae bacterium]
MKKATVVLLLALGLLFPLLANGTQEKGAPDNKEQVVTLKISHNMDFTTIPDAVVDAATKVNARYAKEGKNIHIEFEKDYQTIDWTEYQNNIVFAHKIDDAPDIYAISDPAGLMKAGLLLDLTDMVKANADKFVNNVFSPVTEDGRIYAFPPDLPVRVIYYSKKDLKAIGWTDEQIKAFPVKIQKGEFSFEDFLALCQEVVTKGGAKYGLTHRPGNGSDFLDIIQVLGGEYYDEKGTLVFDETGLTRFFQMTYDNANVTRITPQNLNQMGWTTINTMVGTGESFAYYGPIYSCSYVASAVKLTNAEFASQEEFVLFPVSQYSQKPFVVAAPQYIGVSSKTKYPEICKDLLTELVNGSTGLLARHAAKINSLSSVVAGNKDSQIDANPIIRNIAYMADYAITTPCIDGIANYRSELFKQIVALELGQTTPEKAVADMKAQIQLNVKNVIYK